MDYDGMAVLGDELSEMALRINTKKALEAGAEIIAKEVRNRAPVLSGNLRDNGITYEIREDAAEIGWTDAGFYGRFHEYGTSKMAAKPYMRPAFEAVKDEAVKAMRKELLGG